MSGPKVITIVSLEEVVDICRVLLAQVDAEIAEWSLLGNRHSAISPSDEASVQQSRASLTRSLKAGQHLSVQKEAPLMIRRLRSDMQQWLEQAESFRQRQSRSIRSLQFTATAVLEKADSDGIILPSDITDMLQKARSGHCKDIGLMEKAISSGIELTRRDQSVGGELSEISRQLSSSSKSESLDDWLHRNQQLQQPDKRLTTAEKLIGQIRVLDKHFSGERFEIRLQEIAAKEDSSNRSLLLDNICLELNSLLKKTTEWATLRQKTGESRVEAMVSGEFDVLQMLFEQVDVCQQNDNLMEAKTLTETIQEALNSARMRKSGEKKRQAIIQGLSEIGYAVNPEMSKVWTSQKQVVVRRASNASTGIELGGSLDAGRCQVRVVALEGTAASGDQKTDKEHEEQWCSDLQRLQEKLASAGASLKVENSTAAGVVPLKIVKGHWSTDFEAETTEVITSRLEQKRSK